MRTTIGIDMGGTKIEGVLYDTKYKALQTTRLPTDAQSDTKTILNNIFKVVEELKKENTTGIGISFAGVINDEGKVEYAPNIKPLEGVNLKNELQKKFSIETKIENDARCFALAENLAGAGKKKRICVGVIIGTGVGSGIIIDGKPYRGSSFSAGEIGHGIRGPLLGEFEHFLAGPGVQKRYLEQTGKELSSEDILNAKDDASKKIIQETHEETARFLSLIVLMINPDVIVLGGGVSKSLDYKELNKLTNNLVPEQIRDSFEIKKHATTDASGSLGAALLFPNIEEDSSE